MTRPLRRLVPMAAGAGLLAVLVYTGSGGYLGLREEAPSRPAPAGQPVVLPDLSRLEPAVRQQIRDEHARATSVLDADRSDPAERAEASASLGRLLLAAEYYVEAEQAFLTAQALAPADMRWPYYLGHVYRARQQPARAISMFERTLAVAPDDIPALIWLGDQRLASGDATAAEPPLLRALALQPTSAAAAARLGQAALDRREYARAVEFLERALQLNPRAGVEYPLGMAYRALGRAAQAESHLARTSDGRIVAPPDPLMDRVAGLLRGAGAFEARGMEALDARDWRAAVDNLQQAVSLAPDNAVTRLNLGTALSLAGHADAARRELLEAARLEPRLAKAHFGLGVLAQEAGRWSEAIERFAAAVAHAPEFVDAHFTLAEALRRSGRADEALAHYAAVLALDPAASQARFGRAMALVRLGRFVEVRQVLDEAVRLHPDQPGLPHALARILAAAPDPQVRDGRRALLLMQPLATGEPGAAVSETMAMVMAETGRFDEAIDWQQRAIASASAAGQSALAVRMQDSLARYRQRQPCRTPWRDDDPVIATVAGS